MTTLIAVGVFVTLSIIAAFIGWIKHQIRREGQIQDLTRLLHESESLRKSGVTDMTMLQKVEEVIDRCPPKATDWADTDPDITNLDVGYPGGFPIYSPSKGGLR